jgi:hypothetical protein
MRVREEKHLAGDKYWQEEGHRDQDGEVAAGEAEGGIGGRLDGHVLKESG